MANKTTKPKAKTKAQELLENMYETPEEKARRKKIELMTQIVQESYPYSHYTQLTEPFTSVFSELYSMALVKNMEKIQAIFENNKDYEYDSLSEEQQELVDKLMEERANYTNDFVNLIIELEERGFLLFEPAFDIESNQSDVYFNDNGEIHLLSPNISEETVRYMKTAKTLQRLLTVNLLDLNVISEEDVQSDGFDDIVELYLLLNPNKPLITKMSNQNSNYLNMKYILANTKQIFKGDEINAYVKDNNELIICYEDKVSIFEQIDAKTINDICAYFDQVDIDNPETTNNGFNNVHELLNEKPYLATLFINQMKDMKHYNELLNFEYMVSGLNSKAYIQEVLDYYGEEVDLEDLLKEFKKEYPDGMPQDVYSSMDEKDKILH